MKQATILILVLLLMISFNHKAPASPDGKTNLLLCTDAGCDIDDQFVVAHLMLSPQFRVRGIVTTHAPNLASAGPKAVDDRGAPMQEAAITKAVVVDVLNHIPGGERPPVIEGSSRPLTSTSRPNHNAGVQFIIDQSRSFSPTNRLVILVIGAATDLASALVEDPTLAHRIEVVGLGFNEWAKGGDRFNIKNDVAAWQIVFDSDLPLTMADCEVAIRCLFLDDQTAARVLGSNGALGQYLERLVRQERTPDLARKVTGRTRWPIWDEATVAYLLGFAKVSVYPRPKLLDDTMFDHRLSSPPRSINWVTSIDSGALWNDLEQKLVGRARPL